MILRGTLLALTIAVAGCTQSGNVTRGESVQALMARVARQVQICWFKAKDPTFTKYKMATELDSFSGRPRILIVPRNKPTGLPQLVAQAERKSGRNTFTTFGPLLSGAEGPRLNASLAKWANGTVTC
ncbi:MAG: hypothetical protein AAGF28_07205 [Pseudomonadota bacterium]